MSRNPIPKKLNTDKTIFTWAQVQEGVDGDVISVRFESTSVGFDPNDPDDMGSFECEGLLAHITTTVGTYEVEEEATIVISELSRFATYEGE